MYVQMTIDIRVMKVQAKKTNKHSDCGNALWLHASDKIMPHKCTEVYFALPLNEMLTVSQRLLVSTSNSIFSLYFLYHL